MTRKQRQAGGGNNVTYDLSNPRNVAAFEALLEAEGGDDLRQLPPRGKRGEQPKKREKEKFFMLKDTNSTARPEGQASRRALDSQQQQNEQLNRLTEMFGGAAESSMIADVFRGAGNNFEAAVDALLNMLGGATAQAGAASSSSAAAACISSSPLQDSQLPSSFAWSDLPVDVKLAILSHLPLRDLARVASTCREFYSRASHMRRHVHRLLLPAGLSYSGLVGMVAGHGAAEVMDMSKLERHISRLDADDMVPQVVAMHKQEAEANMFKSVLAVAEGAAAPARQQPVTGLVLKGLVGATDRVLAEALQNLKGLRSLDLSHCPNITNKSLYLLAKYKATDHLQQQQQQAEQQEDASSDEYDYELYAGSSSYSSSSGSEGEWEQWPEEEFAEHEAQQQQWQEQEPASLGADNAGSIQEASSAAGLEPAQLEAVAADSTPHETGQVVDSTDSSSINTAVEQPVTQPNPAIHDPVNTGLASAVTNRLAALELRASQQAVAAAQAVADAAVLGLTELRLAGNRGLADDGLRHVLQGPVIKHSLAVLDISGCKGLSSAGLIVPPLGVLRELCASRVQGLTQLILHMPADHPLEKIDLSGCHYLRVVDLALNNLRQLNLNACRTLYRLRMRCPILASLSLAQCGMLHEFHTDAWQVPMLQHLNLFGCRRASGAMLQPVLDTLPELRSLCLNGCWSIHSLHLTGQLHLEACDITGCRNLVHFSSSSPCLRELAASACGRLYSLTLGSSTIQSLQLVNCSQLVEVHVAEAAPPPPPSSRRSNASSGNSAGHQGAAMHIGGTCRSSGRGAAAATREAAGGQKPSVKGLNLNGCSMLSDAAKARLNAAVMKRR